MGQKITIHMHTTIDDNGQMEYSTLKQHGVYHRKNNFDVVTFDEQTEENGLIKNMITIQQYKVNIKRSGTVAMNQQFITNRTTENVFNHPYGTIHMETNTKSIVYQPLEADKTGRLTIKYTVKLNGQEERVHKLELVFDKEESK